MAIISLQEITLAFGGPLLFDRLSLQLESGERVALLGRNGVGKTTLMKVISGQLKPDDGKVSFAKGVQVAYLPQEIPSNMIGNVSDIVLSGLGELAKLVSDYHHVSHRLETEHTQKLLDEFDRLQTEMNRSNAWEIDRQVENVLSHMKLDGQAEFQLLSGGQKRRTLLAKALVSSPQILMLDEPTNHLDIDSINWLENFLQSYPGTIFFVTHDRMFMSHLATKIVELDRGKFFSWTCDYKTFLERKQRALEIEAAQQIEFDKKLADEEVWIRKGVKARRTRNEGRVKALLKMREEKKAQRRLIGKARMNLQEADFSGQLVCKATHLRHGYGDKILIKDFSTLIMRGDKIGVIGANGSGKTTLLRILLGKLVPQEGTIQLGTNLQAAYYDQLREQLDGERSVLENVTEGTSDQVIINGRPRHVIGYLKDFLFSPERVRTPVKVLSGGERNRLCLARLFTKPSNLLIMDEPTNDLDVETLELLEDLLVEYSGTLLLVSHDREFLNNVVTSTIVLEEDGVIGEYPGGYDDWLAQRKLKTDIVISEESPEKKLLESKKEQVGRKRSFKEQEELSSLPSKVEKLEAIRDEIYTLLSDTAFYQRDPKDISQTKVKLESTESALLEIYERWEYLEALE